MSITLNEKTWAEEAINTLELGSRPSETLSRIAKYYLYCGKTPKETRKLLDDFLLMCEPNVSLVIWEERLDNAMKYALKHPIIILDPIHITENEINTIKAVQGVQAQRLAFTLLCVAKYNKIINANNEYWVNTPDSELMRMANINTSIRRQSILFSKLRDAGLIRFSKNVDSLSVQVLFCSDGKTIVEIKDYRNLGYQYLKLIGGKDNYYVCQNCGMTFKSSAKTGRPPKYCDACASKIRTKQNVDSVMRLRMRS